MADRTPEITRLELMQEDASIKLSTGRGQPDQRLGAGDAGRTHAGDRALGSSRIWPTARRGPNPGLD
jgi:hypothetical protein